MEYQLGWSENHPGHVVYLLDLSESMAANGKIDNLIKAVDDVVKDLIQQSAPSGEIENNMTLTIIGYNSDVETIINNKPLTELYSIFMNGKSLLNKETNAIPRWQTFTAAGMHAVAKDINTWIEKQEAAGVRVPAPLVVHVTDGYPYEGDETSDDAFTKALNAALAVKAIKTPDGHVRLFNIHIEPGMPSCNFPMSRPSQAGDVGKIMKFLYDSASEVDEGAQINADLLLNSWEVKTGSKFMVSNISGKGLLSKLIRFGSTPSSLPLKKYMEKPKP